MVASACIRLAWIWMPLVLELVFSSRLKNARGLPPWVHPPLRSEDEASSPRRSIFHGVQLNPALRFHDTSFTYISRWPTLRLYTFGEGAFRGNVTEKFPKIRGARVINEGDPVSAVLGQVFGFSHQDMVPAVHSESDAANDNLMEHIAKALRDEKEQIDLKHLFSLRSWSRHGIDRYTKHLKQRLTQGANLRKRLKFWWDNLGSADERLETYRMALLTKLMSYVDASAGNVQSALTLLNEQMNPIKPQRRLFEKKLQHVMSFSFFTQCGLISRTLNLLGLDRLVYRMNRTVVGEGLVHNVHLLKDRSNNGYLTFQGTVSMGTWIAIHLNKALYKLEDPDLETQPLEGTVDDARWATIERKVLTDCHSGLCETLKAFVRGKEFKKLAKEITRLRSLSVVGHSFGGELASMFTMCAQKIKMQHEEQLREVLWFEDFEC